MAMFGNINTLKKQVKDPRFDIAFAYLEKVLYPTSEEHARLKGYELDSFVRIDLDENNFALEQTYFSKGREKCFFESHRQNIDVQFILEGEEIIEVGDISDLNVTFAYDEHMDLIKYGDSTSTSAIRLRAGDIAIFFPEDAHMPCIQTDAPSHVIKTVVKVRID